MERVQGWLPYGVAVQLMVTFRDLEFEDLIDLDWSGGTAHQRVVAEALGLAFEGEVEVICAVLPNGRLVALGGVDFRPSLDAGMLWMLSVHETLQGVKLGTELVAELEQRIRLRRRPTATLTVEHDNPRAQALYRRLGYVVTASSVEDWPLDSGARYVTVCAVMTKTL